jgi:release factor glutamine methyltransferase
MRGSSWDHRAVAGRLRTAGCVYADEEADLLLAQAASVADLDVLVGRRCAGEPLEHVLGWARFGGLRVAVRPGVFVPRARSELLAAQAVSWARQSIEDGQRGPVVVDLCCGTGALGLVVATRVPGVLLHAVDLDPAAVVCARENLAGLGAVHTGDLDEPLPADLRGRVDLLVANVPYVPTDAVATLPVEARDHEPRLALDGGPDGLDVVRRVAALAPGWLAPGGSVLVETTAAQAGDAADAFGRNGLTPSVVSSDELGATVVSGVLAPGDDPRGDVATPDDRGR